MSDLLWDTRGTWIEAWTVGNLEELERTSKPPSADDGSARQRTPPVVLRKQIAGDGGDARLLVEAHYRSHPRVRSSSMPLTSSPPQQSSFTSSPSSLPRRLTFTTDSAQQQYQSAMKSVQQYLGSHIPAEHLAMLGVNDFRARYYYDEIQQYLAQRVSHEKQPTQQQQRQQSQVQAQRRLQRRDSERLLLQNLDEFLDELDPALFEPFMTSNSAKQPPLHSCNNSNNSKVPSRMKRPCSYIKEMQQEARMYKNFCHDATPAHVMKKQKQIETMK